MMELELVRKLFLSKVQVSDGCWEWAGTMTKAGYGQLTVDGVRHYAHRVSVALDGRDPTGLECCHACDNPRCVRSDHLFLGTHAENMADMAAKGRWTDREVSRGSKHKLSKLDDDTVRAIRFHRAMGVEGSELARIFGISNPVVSKIVLRKMWKHVL